MSLLTAEGLDDVQRSLPIQTILWFYDTAAYRLLPAEGPEHMKYLWWRCQCYHEMKYIDAPGRKVDDLNRLWGDQHCWVQGQHPPSLSAHPGSLCRSGARLLFHRALLCPPTPQTYPSHCRAEWNSRAATSAAEWDGAAFRCCIWAEGCGVWREVEKILPVLSLNRTILLQRKGMAMTLLHPLLWQPMTKSKYYEKSWD